MKALNLLKGSLLALTLFLAATAFAANKGSFELNNPASLGGKQLAAGNYNLQWDGDGPNVRINVLKGNKVVCSVPAHVNNLDRAPDHNEAVVNVATDGSRSVSEIRLSGKKYAFEVSDAGGGSSSGGNGVR